MRGRIQRSKRVRRILIKRDPDELSSAAAELFVQIARTSIAERRSFSVALAGGSTPRTLYSLLAREHKTAIDWSKVTFFFTDERNVPNDSPESNYRMAKETLFEPLSISQGNVVSWVTELQDPKEIASLYDLEISLALDPTVAPSRNFTELEADKILATSETWQDGLPRFDLILLGLGSDSHTASLFPHTAALRETEKLAVANWVEKLNDFRLTITFPVINNASNVIFLVAGAEKVQAVTNVLEGPFDPDDFPAQRVRPENGILYWLLDKAAASSLKR